MVDPRDKERVKHMAMRLFAATIILFLSTASIASGNEVPIGDRFGFGVGYALARFDTSVKFTDKSSGQSVFVDEEGTLGLPDSDAVPVFYGMYRISKGNAIGLSYFQVKRKSSIIDFDKTLEDVTIVGQAEFSDDTSFYNISYLNTFYEDDRSRVLGKFGINVLDIRYSLDAQGTITYRDNTVTSSLHEEIDIVAPLPLFGLDFWYSFTPKWGISTQVTFIGGTYDDVTAGVFTTEVNARYRLSKTFGAVMGISYFNANVTIEDSDDRSDVKYGYSGAFLGLHVIL